MKRYPALFLLLCLFLAPACRERRQTVRLLDGIQGYAQAHPDSARAALENISPALLSTPSLRARHALIPHKTVSGLMSSRIPVSTWPLIIINSTVPGKIVSCHIIIKDGYMKMPGTMKRHSIRIYLPNRLSQIKPLIHI